MTTNKSLMTPSARRSTGKIHGSKNKSRSNSLPMTQSTDSSVNVFTFNVAPNSDVMECIFDIANRDQVSVTVIGASGRINNATLQSSTCSAPNFVLHGPFTLISLTGSYLYNNQYTLHPGATPPLNLSFGINLSTNGGKVFCGIVGGSIIARENVKITVSTYRNPHVLKYTVEGQDEGDSHSDDNENHTSNNKLYKNNPSNYSENSNFMDFNPMSFGVCG
ncbi:hypothetical protein PHAVU_006G031000 [Phaseolus vulgaris]|uniref:PPC domain-containing protein n=1 Tax=Phaseolus vulgaris TaxID=3885 RepID=V7BP12_PHAVU|nr:hypothetical protein PHAVU_006G031000g [Phaseolus vulgaris]ESW18321.1 hypothetical protein PHAVU_006G031000g [Phaseolus vulgaris]